MGKETPGRSTKGQALRVLVLVAGRSEDGARIFKLAGVNPAPFCNPMSGSKCIFKNSAQSVITEFLATFFPTLINDL